MSGANGRPARTGAARQPISGVVDRRPKRAPIDWDLAIERYRAGWTLKEIAEAAKYTAARVRGGLLERGVKMRKRVARSYDVKLLYGVWREVLKRALARTPSGKPNTIEPSWKTFEGFQAFALANGYRPRMALVRLDPERGLHPKNVRFVEKKDVAKYTRWAQSHKPTKLVTAFGETKGVTEWSRDPRCTVTAPTLCERLLNGMPPELAITHPPARGRKKLPGMKLRRGDRVSSKRRYDWEHIRALYEKEGLTVGDIARRLGSARGVIRDGLKRAGVTMRAPADLTTTPHGRVLATLWASIKARCEDPRDRDYARIGARGIRMSPKWKANFRAFHDWILAQGWKPHLCLVRMDLEKGYSPENCRLSTFDLVARRTTPKRKPIEGHIFITAFGETRSLAAWSRDPRAAVSERTLAKRLREGVHPEDAITEPAGPRRGPAPRLHEAFGQKRSQRDWLRDKRCRVESTTLRRRLKHGMSFEEALTTPPWRTPAQERARAELSRPAAGRGARKGRGKGRGKGKA